MKLFRLIAESSCPLRSALPAVFPLSILWPSLTGGVGSGGEMTHPRAGEGSARRSETGSCCTGKVDVVKQSCAIFGSGNRQ